MCLTMLDHLTTCLAPFTACHLSLQVAQDDRFWCEGDGCYVDKPEHRYIISARIADPTGEMYVTVFNDQVRTSGNCMHGCQWLLLFVICP